MAVYKVIQNVEAEDKLLGPLTFKGFIYAGVALLCGFINFKLLFIGSPIKWAIIVPLLIPMVLFGVLASPLGREQPTEVWLLSKIRFFIKPRLRLWDQSGMEELVKITVPKKLEERLTKDISQSEVRSRLKTLASTLDTRGWAIKNVDLNLNVVTPQEVASNNTSDRLVANAGYTQPAPVLDLHAADDILDEQNNPTAQKFASLMKTADDERKRNVLETMKGLVNETIIKPSPSKKTRISKAKTNISKHKADKPELPEVASKVIPKTETPRPQVTPPVTPERQAVNMELAQSGSAFSVATLSQLANRQPHIEQTGPNEVTISLH